MLIFFLCYCCRIFWSVNLLHIYSGAFTTYIFVLYIYHRGGAEGERRIIAEFFGEKKKERNIRIKDVTTTCCSQKSQTVFWFSCNWNWFIFNFLCDVKFLSPSLSFPLRQSWVSVMLLLSLLLRWCKVCQQQSWSLNESNIHHRWQRDGVCAVASICLALQQSCGPLQTHTCPL